MSVPTLPPTARPDNLRARLGRKRVELLVFAAMCSLYFFSFFHRVGVPGAIFDELQATFHLSARGVTALAEIYLYTYAGLQIAVGFAADRFGATRMLLLAAGSLLFPLSPTPWLLYLTRGLVGVGASFMYLCILKEIDPLFGARHFPPMLGLLLMTGYMGGLAGTSPLAALTAKVGWRYAMMPAGVLCLVALMVTALLLRRTAQVRRAGNRLSWRAVRRLLATTGIYPLLLVIPINFAAYMVVQATIGKKMLQDCGALGSAAAAGVTSVMLVIVAAGSLGSGFLPRWTRQRRKPVVVAASVITLLASALLAYALASSRPVYWLIVGYFMLALATSLGTLSTTLFKEISPPSTVALAIGVINGVVYLVVAIMSQVAGRVLDAYSGQAHRLAEAVIYPRAAYATYFAIIAALACVSVAAAMIVPETHGLTADEDAPDLRASSH